ncbi:hypothetical protein [Streptomyces sp.]|uniref:hypothetical protein n=1 Tax=Streptomyces sp. TaxID=1931 RepID=UPI0028116806|nr:hypothetical protein [Streptomyces sp.]
MYAVRRSAYRSPARVSVREAVAEATRVEAPLPVTVVAFLASPTRGGGARRAVDADLAAFPVGHEESAVRRAVAHSPHVPTALARALGSDTDPGVGAGRAG